MADKDNLEQLAKIHYTEYALRQDRTMPAWHKLLHSEQQDCIAALGAAIAEMSMWRDIEDMPEDWKDGRFVVLWQPGVYPYVSFWIRDGNKEHPLFGGQETWAHTVADGNPTRCMMLLRPEEN